MVVAFDEPFHPRLWEGQRQNAKGTWDELGDYWNEIHPDSRFGVTPIMPLDELDTGISKYQAAYLRDLIGRGEQTAIDTVRAWNKAGLLVPDDGTVTVVHLMRSPVHWVGAHLLPSGRGTWRKVIANWYRRQSFFSRTGFYNNWQYQEIIDAALEGRHSIWENISLEPEELARAPAYEKLLAFWWVANLETHRQLSSLKNTPVITITLDDFLEAPETLMHRVYKSAGWPVSECGFALDHIGAVRPAFRADKPQWVDAASRLGVPEYLVTRPVLSAEEICLALEGAQ